MENCTFRISFESINDSTIKRVQFNSLLNLFVIAISNEKYEIIFIYLWKKKSLFREIVSAEKFNVISFHQNSTKWSGSMNFCTFRLLLAVSRALYYAVLRITCTPESVSTGMLSSPTFRANAASSNGLCMAPLANGPRSPPFLADEQSEYFWANSANVNLPDTISSR